MTISASHWLTLLEEPERIPAFRNAYGNNDALITARAHLARRVAASFLDRFGDMPLRLFRAPGRINLRGMHVDTHGGFLNLMTHQRETMLAATVSNDGTSILANVNNAFSETVFTLQDEQENMPRHRDWWEAIASPAIAARVRARNQSPETAWANYGIGATLRTARLRPEAPLLGLKMMVDSDLPRGAALSSSAALSVAALLACTRCNGIEASSEELVQAEQDVEWYAGARVGMSDQTAILLGRPGMVLHLAVFARDFSLAGARYTPFPEALALLVVNSHTTRALSGGQRLQYTLNRFAYSMALTVLRAELRQAGWSSEAADRMDRLSRITPEALGGNAGLYALLRRIPIDIDIATLRQRYSPPDLDGEYARYFGDLDEIQQPTRIPLRGPLFFGIAESERARLFPETLAAGDYAQAGRLMSIGHDGDRQYNPDGAPFSTDISDEMLDALAREHAPVALQPGAYGASSAALDALVDTALAAGALGASLTGAGIAGATLALCRREDVAAIAKALSGKLQEAAYARCALLDAPLDPNAAAQAVTINQAVAGANELVVGD